MKIKVFLILICVAFVFVSCSQSGRSLGSFSQGGLGEDNVVCPEELPEGCTACEVGVGESGVLTCADCEAVSLEGFICNDGTTPVTTVSPPTFSHSTGTTFDTATNINISTDTPDARILYRTTPGNISSCNDSVPSSSSGSVSIPITSYGSMTIKAIACVGDVKSSQVSAIYTLASPPGTVQTPVIDVSGSVMSSEGQGYVNSVSVTINVPTGSYVRYNSNTNTPNFDPPTCQSGTQISDALTQEVTQIKYFKAIACSSANSLNPSPVTTKEVYLQVEKPVFRWDSNNGAFAYNGNVDYGRRLVIREETTVSDPGASIKICYGTNPEVANGLCKSIAGSGEYAGIYPVSAEYTGSTNLLITKPVTIKAFAFKPGYLTSGTRAHTYGLSTGSCGPNYQQCSTGKYCRLSTNTCVKPIKMFLASTDWAVTSVAKLKGNVVSVVGSSQGINPCTTPSGQGAHYCDRQKLDEFCKIRSGRVSSTAISSNVAISGYTCTASSTYKALISFGKEVDTLNPSQLDNTNSNAIARIILGNEDLSTREIWSAKGVKIANSYQALVSGNNFANALHTAGVWSNDAEDDTNAYSYWLGPQGVPDPTANENSYTCKLWESDASNKKGTPGTTFKTNTEQKACNLEKMLMCLCWD